MPIHGIQDTAVRDVIEQLQAENHRLWQEVINLRSAHRNAANFVIKIFGDAELVVVSDGAFIFAVPEDVDGLFLEIVEAFLTDTGSGATEIDIYNLTRDLDMLSENLTIQSFDEHSDETYVLNNRNKQVFWKNQLSIDVKVAAASSRGLGVILGFM